MKKDIVNWDDPKLHEYNNWDHYQENDINDNSQNVSPRNENISECNYDINEWSMIEKSESTPQKTVDNSDKFWF